MIIQLGIYFLIVLVFGYFFMKRRSLKQPVGVYDSIMLAMIGYYCVVPIIILLFSRDNQKEYYSTLFYSNLSTYVFAFIAIVLLIVVFDKSYYFEYKKKNNNHYYLDEKRLFLICQIISIITFLIGGVSFLVYIKAFGSVSSLLSKAEYLRTFASNPERFISYYESLLVIPARAITVTPIITAPLLHSRIHNKIVYQLIFLMSVPLGLLFNLSNAGKTALVLYGLCLLFPILYQHFKHPWFVLILFGIMGVPLINVADALFLYFQNGHWELSLNGLMDNIKQFYYPTKNILSMQNVVDLFGIRWGQDYFTGILNIIPGVNFQPSYEIISQYYVGSNWKIYGGTPDDVITFGFLELKWIGIVINAFLMGFISSQLDVLLKDFKGTYGHSVLKTAVILCFFTLVTNFDIVSIVRTQFTLTLSVFCILFSMRKAYYGERGF